MISIRNQFQEAWQRDEFLVAREHAVTMRNLYQVDTMEYHDWESVAALCRVFAIEVEYYEWYKATKKTEEESEASRQTRWKEALSKVEAIIAMYESISSDRERPVMSELLVSVENPMWEWKARQQIFKGRLYPPVGPPPPTVTKVHRITARQKFILIEYHICPQSDETKVVQTSKVADNSMLVYVQLEETRDAKKVPQEVLTVLRNSSEGIVVDLLLSWEFRPLFRIIFDYDQTRIHREDKHTVAEELHNRWSDLKGQVTSAMSAHDPTLTFTIEHEYCHALV